MASKTEVANVALAMLGANPLTDVDTEQSVIARRIRQVYNTLRDDALRAHPWNFAIKRIALTKLDTAPAFGFAYYYAKPSDYLRAIQGESKSDKFKVEGQYIASDVDGLKIQYIARVEEEAYWDSNFVAAFAQNIASAIAYPVTDSRTLGKDMYDLYGERLSMAKAIDAQEGVQDELDDGQWLEDRAV